MIWPPSRRAQGVAPLQPAELADADAGDVEQLQQHAVTALVAGLDQAGDLAFLEDPLRQVVGVGPQLDRGADVEGKIAGLMGKRKQTLHRGEGAVLAGGGETSLPQVLGPGLQIGQRHRGQALADEGEKAAHVAPVGAAGVGAGLRAQPQAEDVELGRQCPGGGAFGEAGGWDDGELVHGVIIARYVALSCVQAPVVRYHPPSSVASWGARVVAFAMIVANHGEVR